MLLLIFGTPLRATIPPTRTMLAANNVTRFKMRGLIGLSLIAAGISLAIMFKKDSLWAYGTKGLMLACAYFCGIGGSALLTSYIQQSSLCQIKNTLAGMRLLLTVMLLNCLQGIL